MRKTQSIQKNFIEPNLFSFLLKDSLILLAAKFLSFCPRVSEPKFDVKEKQTKMIEWVVAPNNIMNSIIHLFQMSPFSFHGMIQGIFLSFRVHSSALLIDCSAQFISLSLSAFCPSLFLFANLHVLILFIHSFWSSPANHLSTYNVFLKKVLQSP